MSVQRILELMLLYGNFGKEIPPWDGKVIDYLQDRRCDFTRLDGPFQI